VFVPVFFLHIMYLSTILSCSRFIQLHK
jgi:hypothetical protein